MILDLLTLYVVSALVLAVVAALFVLEVVSRGVTPIDRYWTMALAAALGTAVCYAASELPGLWWCVALGNSASIATTFAVWSGVRAHEGRRPRSLVGVAVAAVGLLITLVQGPAGGEWAGGGYMIAATGVGALLGASEALRGRMRRSSAGRVLTAVLLVVGAYYGLRLYYYAAEGPYSTEFRTYAGTELTTLVVLLFVLAAGLAMNMLRIEYVHQQRERRQNFDPATGARTAASFSRRSEAWLTVARSAGRPVALVSVVVDSLDQIGTAFGSESAERALVTVGEICREEAPAPALVGRSATEDGGFEILLVGQAPAAVEEWAEQLRKRVLDSPLDVPGSAVRLRVSIGVAAEQQDCYELARLCAAARARAREALADGGNRVVTAAR